MDCFTIQSIMEACYHYSSIYGQIAGSRSGIGLHQYWCDIAYHRYYSANRHSLDLVRHPADNPQFILNTHRNRIPRRSLHKMNANLHRTKQS